MHPEFKKALDAGMLTPAILNGEHIIVDGQRYYQASESGAKMMMQRFNQINNMLQKHERLKLSDSMLKSAFSALKDMFNKQFEEITVAFKTGTFDQDAFSRLIDLQNEQKKLISRMDERIDVGFDLYQSYETAALWYITEDEDPAYTTAAKLKEKVNAMMQRPELYAFFLRIPLTGFEPLSLLFDSNILNSVYNRIMLEELDLKALSLNASTLGLNNETISFIQSRQEELPISLDLIESLSTSSTESFRQ